MGNKIRRADALREMETREKANGKASHFSLQFYLKNGELVSFPRAVVKGLKADMKRSMGSSTAAALDRNAERLFDLAAEFWGDECLDNFFGTKN